MCYRSILKCAFKRVIVRGLIDIDTDREMKKNTNTDPQSNVQSRDQIHFSLCLLVKNKSAVYSADRCNFYSRTAASLMMVWVSIVVQGTIVS